MLAALLLTLSPAEIRPSFGAELAAWRAAEIVVVDEGEVLDGEVVVVERWRGTLPVGTRLTVPALADFAAEEERTSYGWFSSAVTISGGRVVLFMLDGALGEQVNLSSRRRSVSSGNSTSGPRHDAAMAPIPVEVGAETRRLRPVTPFGSWRVSMAWIEGEALYALTQLVNPGPALMTEQEGGVKRLRELVRAFDLDHERAQRALRLDDLVARAEALAPCLVGAAEHPIPRLDVFEALVDCGDAAVSTIEGWGRDVRTAPLVSRSLGRIGGEAGAAALERLLAYELAYWRELEVERPLDDDASGDLRGRAYRSSRFAYDLASIGPRIRGRALVEELVEVIGAKLGECEPVERLRAIRDR